MIGIEQVSVRFGAAAALDRVSVRVATGEWAAVVGPNGAGKTTLLRAVARMLRYDGMITVDGQQASSLSRRALARLIAYVPQRPLFPAEMTAAEYVLLGRTPHIGYFRVETAADRRISTEMLDRLQLGAMAARPLRTMSGGELQRLVLARALCQQAPVLLLDEPTSALDLGRRVDALELIDQFRREQSLTVLSAVHDLTLAGQFADRLVLLASGQVAAAGPPAQILRAELLTQYFGVGIQVLTTADGALAVLSRRPAGQPRGR